MVRGLCEDTSVQRALASSCSCDQDFGLHDFGLSQSEVGGGKVL